MIVTRDNAPKLKQIPVPKNASRKEREFIEGMVRVNHLFTSAMKVALTQLEILDDEFSSLYDHSPIHHVEYRIKSTDSIIKKLNAKEKDINIDNVYTYISDVAGIRIVCNYLEDIYYLRDLLRKDEHFGIIEENDYIQSPKESGYRSLHVLCNVPFMISEGRMELPVEVQMRTIAQDMWASLEHEIRYKSDRVFDEKEALRLRLCSEAISEVDVEMQNIYHGNPADYDETPKEKK